MQTVSIDSKKRVEKERDGNDSADESDDDPDGNRFEAFLKLYTLADKLQESEMMNASALQGW
jgi:hypothetical protein